MTRPPPPIRLVLFDAFDTLLQPSKPPYVQYAEVARKHGLSVQDSEVKHAFKSAFLETSKAHPNYGLQTLLSPDEWWIRVIRTTFSPSLHPSLSPERYAQTIPTIATELVHRFGTREAYHLYDDVLPLLTKLHHHLVPMAIATNSDPRILAVLRSYHLDRFFHLDSDQTGPRVSPTPSHPDSSTKPLQYPVGAQRRAVPTLSYYEGHAKPSRLFFHAALRNNGFRPDEANQVLYVGDQLEEDFEAATNAGLQALWLQRGGESNQPSPSENHGRERTGTQQDEFRRERTIRSLDLVARFLALEEAV